MIVLHGFLGASDNLMSLGKALAETHRVVMVDQRNHGRSPHQAPHTYAAMAEDLGELYDELGLETANLFGHSMGGKTAMRFAIDQPEQVDKLIVADIGPRAYSPHHGNIFEGLRAIPVGALKSRSEADDVLSKYVSDVGERLFLLKNLARESESYSWRINFPLLDEAQFTVIESIEGTYPADKPVLFLDGDQSDYIRDQDWPGIVQQFPSAQRVTIKDAAHWIHAQQPEQVLAAVNAFLSA